jgi:hypothetical protein
MGDHRRGHSRCWVPDRNPHRCAGRRRHRQGAARRTAAPHCCARCCRRRRRAPLLRTRDGALEGGRHGRRSRCHRPIGTLGLPKGAVGAASRSIEHQRPDERCRHRRVRHWSVARGRHGHGLVLACRAYRSPLGRACAQCHRGSSIACAAAHGGPPARGEMGGGGRQGRSRGCDCPRQARRALRPRWSSTQGPECRRPVARHRREHSGGQSSR